MNAMRASIILDPDQALLNAGSDLGPNCLKTLHVSEDGKSSWAERELKVIRIGTCILLNFLVT